MEKRRVAENSTVWFRYKVQSNRVYSGWDASVWRVFLGGLKNSFITEVRSTQSVKTYVKGERSVPEWRTYKMNSPSLNWVKWCKWKRYRSSLNVEVVFWTRSIWASHNVARLLAQQYFHALRRLINFVPATTTRPTIFLNTQVFLVTNNIFSVFAHFTTTYFIAV